MAKLTSSAWPSDPAQTHCRQRREADVTVRSRSLLVAAAVIAGGLVSGTVAVAGVPDDSGVIHSCYSQAKGTWHPIDSPAQKCGKGETALSWNQAGPAGPTGPMGPVGPAGPAGPTGPAGLLSSFDDVQGLACRVGDPLVGTIDVDYADDGGVTLTCVSTATHTLTVQRTGSGSGSVTSAPSGLDCPGTCSQDFPVTSTVVLTATPDAGHVFGGWTGDCSGQSTTCTLPMNADRTVTAKFRLLRTLTVTIDPELIGGCPGLCIVKGGSVAVFIGFSDLGQCVVEQAGDLDNPPCEFQIDDGQTARVVPDAEFDTDFAGWGGDCTGTTIPCEVLMDGDRQVTASFLGAS
jgi:uncharacterized repeat protein (TIGR02543 family)